jgi:starch phosphorylase
MALAPSAGENVVEVGKRIDRRIAELFRPLVANLLGHDPFLVLADYQTYVACQDQVSELWRNPQAWARKSILNAARMGKFSSDRSIRDYCQQVWQVKAVSVEGG